METIIAVTGHRPDKLGHDYEYTGPLCTRLKTRIKRILKAHKPAKAFSGMALGVDTIFAEACVELGIPFVAVIPFPGQEDRWIQSSKDRYYRLLEKAEYIEVVCHVYSKEAFQRRNEWMVNNSGLLLSIWDGTEGGTANCTHYAMHKEKKILYLSPKEV